MTAGCHEYEIQLTLQGTTWGAMPDKVSTRIAIAMAERKKQRYSRRERKQCWRHRESDPGDQRNRIADQKTRTEDKASPRCGGAICAGLPTGGSGFR
jgi:hypothetical protein